MIVGSPTILNLVPGGVMKCVHVNQVNKNIEIQFKVMNGAAPYNVPEGVTCTIRGTKGDAFGYAAEAAVTAGSNVITVTLTEQLTAVAGAGNIFELVFVGAADDMKVSTENFILAVERQAMGEDTVISDSDLSYAEQVLDSLQNVAAVNAQVQQNKTNLAAEISRAQAAEAAEAAARQAADNTLQSDINAEASTRATTDASLQSQINQLVAPSGSAPSAAEVENARVGADGTVYQTLGDAIRTQVTDVKSAIHAVTDGGSYDSSVVPTIVTGIAINAQNGNEYSTTAYNATTNVPVPRGATTVTVTASYSESYGVIFYDATGTRIAGSGVYGYIADQYGGTNTSVPQTFTITVPENAATLRTSIRTAYYEKPSDVGIVFHCTLESAYEYADGKVADLKVYADTADSALDQSIKNIADTHAGKNLIDESNTTVGVIQSNGTISTTGSFADYSTSDFVPVTGGTQYFLSVFNSAGVYYSSFRKLYLLYDTEKNVISGTFVNKTGDCTFTPAQDGFVRVSWASVNKPMLEVGSTHTAYEAYYSDFLLNDSFPLTAEMESQIADISGNVLFAKKWAHCGDSFSDYTNKTFSEGEFSGKYASFPRLIAERNGMNLLQDFMLSGRTLAFPANPGTFVNALTCPTQSFYYQNIPADVDYVTIMLGINDCQHTGSGSTGDGEDATGEITLGTIDDTTTATYYGAYNTVCEWLRTNRPFAHVGIIVTNGTTRQDYTEAQIAIAKKWGYPYINLNGDERTPAFIRCYNPNLPTTLKDSLKTIQGVDAPSNTHPNWQTHELESTIIEAWLRSL